MGKVQGEGNYDAAKKFNNAEQAFVKSGKVEQAAANTAPKSQKEALELVEAEKVGKAHPKNKAAELHKQSNTALPVPDAARDQMQP
jgi:hypothetical protein